MAAKHARANYLWWQAAHLDEVATLLEQGSATAALLVKEMVGGIGEGDDDISPDPVNVTNAWRNKAAALRARANENRKQARAAGFVEPREPEAAPVQSHPDAVAYAPADPDIPF